jgi:cytochrome bd-type quinol oxidase subunit 2
MVLDTTMRNQLRVLGVLVCLFGSSIFTASLGSALRVSSLAAVSEGLWVLMGLIFFAAWGVGLILAIRQLIKGEVFNWWQMWKVSAELGPIDVFPPVTPKMEREARLFTIALLSLAVMSVIAALFHWLA